MLELPDGRWVIDDSEIAIISFVPEKSVARKAVIERIAKLIEMFEASPIVINSGECREFADSLQAIIGGIRLNMEDGPLHGWLYWGGRHYDAESPNGVKHWRDLHIFHRFKVVATAENKPRRIRFYAKEKP